MNIGIIIYREELQAAEAEIDRVKSVYVALCEDREKLEINLTEEWKERLNTELKQVNVKQYKKL